jgi:hypothetical protein
LLATDELVIDCRSWQQAQELADTLFAKQLAQSIELIEVKALEVDRDIQKIRLVIEGAENHIAAIKKLANGLRK